VHTATLSRLLGETGWLCVTAAAISSAGDEERLFTQEHWVMAAGEISDKTYVDQCAVPKNRSGQVERRYCSGASLDVIRV